jgi:hypothetical protein
MFVYMYVFMCAHCDVMIDYYRMVLFKNIESFFLGKIATFLIVLLLNSDVG